MLEDAAEATQTGTQPGIRFFLSMLARNNFGQNCHSRTSCIYLTQTSNSANSIYFVTHPKSASSHTTQTDVSVSNGIASPWTTAGPSLRNPYIHPSSLYSILHPFNSFPNSGSYHPLKDIPQDSLLPSSPLASCSPCHDQPIFFPIALIPHLLT